MVVRTLAVAARLFAVHAAGVFVAAVAAVVRLMTVVAVVVMSVFR